ncbi:MAG TPA: glycosyltransferase family 39 protein [Gaiellaceae bacterium]|nr:glycosyltransferase family 39 protein [Gaiellaceae bacterium]
MSRRRAYAVVIAVCALPRIVVLVHERSAILANFEKSNVLAEMYLRNGTFGYVPGHPSAYTQPLYGWFLIPIFWIGGFHWWSVGMVQIAVALATSITVFEIGRRFLSARIGLLAAVIATLQPYLVWHDLHGNREILDQLLGAGLFGLALLAVAHRSVRIGAALGVVSGLAILSNARLLVLPLVLGAFLLWRGVGWAAVAIVPVIAAVLLAPWVIRNKVDVGCFSITTDARSLWKANNPNTYSTLAKGLWLDQVPDIPQRDFLPPPTKWITPEEAGGRYVSNGQVIDVHECAQQAYYEHLVFQFWEHHPGAKVKLAIQATEMLWNPRVGIEGAQSSGVDSLRRWVEPLYTVPLFLLALIGLFCVPLEVRVLALIFVGYETAATWVFAGTTRYRVPWDFVLALLAAAALERAWSALRARRAAGG